MKSLRRLAVRAARLAMILTLVFGAGLLTAAPAAAAIPPSVVLVSAATDKTVILRQDDADLQTLNELLPAWRDGGEGSPPSVAEGRMPDTGRQITVMWRGGRSAVFSVDAVLPGYDGETAWVRKEANVLAGPNGRPDGRWFRADPDLLPLLERLGLYDAAAQPRTPAAAGAGAAKQATVAADPGSTHGWWWAGSALAAGLLLGAGTTLALRRRPSAPRGTEPQT